MLLDDLVLAVLNGGPVQLGAVQALDPEVFTRLHVVVDLGVEQQRLGGDAAHQQAGAAQFLVFFDQAGLQAQLSGADSGGVAARSGPDDGHVVDGLSQGCAPLVRIPTGELINDCTTGQETSSPRINADEPQKTKPQRTRRSFSCSESA